MKNIPFLKTVFWGNSVANYITSLLIFLGCIIFLNIFRKIILKKLKRWAEKTTTTLDDFIVALIQKIMLPLGYLGAFYLSINMLEIAEVIKRLINIATLGVITVFSCRLITSLISYGFSRYLRIKGGGDTLKRSLGGIMSVVRFIVWGLATIFFLDNIGFKVSTVIAGLGIGGVAVALAAQAVLGDLFSYFAIVFDRPFEVGDFIIVGDYLGTVEYVGIKTTRIRSLSGEQLVFSNMDLTNSRVRNYKRMERRRVVFQFGVVYETTLEQLKKIPGIVERIIKSIDDTVFDRAHFFSFGDFSLIFEVVYYVLGSDYNKYMDIQQKINFALKEELEKENIKFAYPTQTLYINKQKD